MSYEDPMWERLDYAEREIEHNFRMAEGYLEQLARLMARQYGRDEERAVRDLIRSSTVLHEQQLDRVQTRLNEMEMA